MTSAVQTPAVAPARAGVLYAYQFESRPIGPSLAAAALMASPIIAIAAVAAAAFGVGWLFIGALGVLGTLAFEQWQRFSRSRWFAGYRRRRRAGHQPVER